MTAVARSARSGALARRIMRALAEAGIPATGPLQAPLIHLEGIECPAVLVEFEGLASPVGISLALDPEVQARFASAMATALAPEVRSPQ